MKDPKKNKTEREPHEILRRRWNRREALLDAASDEFAEHGYQGADMRRIATEAGLRTPSHIHRYFRSKKELYRELTKRTVAPIQELAVSEALLERSPERILAGISRSYLRAYDNPREVARFKLWLGLAAVDAEAAAEELDASGTPTLELLTHIFEELDRRGTIRVQDPSATSVWFLWQLIGYIEIRELMPKLFERLPPLDEYVEQLVDRALFGLATRSPVSDSAPDA